MKTYDLIQTVSSVTSITTPPLDLGDMRNYSVQVTFGGSNVVGTTKLQCSNDDSVYVDIPTSSNSVTASTGIMYTVYEASYRYARLVWTYTSGTGNISAKAIIKEMRIIGV